MGIEDLQVNITLGLLFFVMNPPYSLHHLPVV